MFIKEWSQRQVFETIVSHQSQLHYAPSQNLQYFTCKKKSLENFTQNLYFWVLLPAVALKMTIIFFYIFILKSDSGKDGGKARMLWIWAQLFIIYLLWIVWVNLGFLLRVARLPTATRVQKEKEGRKFSEASQILAEKQ